MRCIVDNEKYESIKDAAKSKNIDVRKLKRIYDVKILEPEVKTTKSVKQFTISDLIRECKIKYIDDSKTITDVYGENKDKGSWFHLQRAALNGNAMTRIIYQRNMYDEIETKKLTIGAYYYNFKIARNLFN